MREYAAIGASLMPMFALWISLARGANSEAWIGVVMVSAVTLSVVSIVMMLGRG